MDNEDTTPPKPGTKIPYTYEDKPGDKRLRRTGGFFGPISIGIIATAGVLALAFGFFHIAKEQRDGAPTREKAIVQLLSSTGSSGLAPINYYKDTATNLCFVAWANAFAVVPCAPIEAAAGKVR